MQSWTQSNVMDREPAELDPARLLPLPGKCIIKRFLPGEKHKSLYLPANSKARRPAFEGEVVAVAGNGDGVDPGFQPGDRVWFHYAVSPDDSAFFVWQGGHYAIVPFEAVQCVAVAG